LWRMLTSMIKPSTHWVLAQTFIICWGPRMGAILQWGVGKYPQRICLRNYNDHGAYP
jgi:homoserine trans-succinylase